MAKQYPDAIGAVESWQNLGYHRMIAAAFEGNDVTYGKAYAMTDRDCITLALEWEGIIGYTDSIISLVKEPTK